MEETSSSRPLSLIFVESLQLQSRVVLHFAYLSNYYIENSTAVSSITSSSTKKSKPIPHINLRGFCSCKTRKLDNKENELTIVHYYQTFLLLEHRFHSVLEAKLRLICFQSTYYHFKVSQTSFSSSGGISQGFSGEICLAYLSMRAIISLYFSNPGAADTSPRCFKNDQFEYLHIE